MTSNPTPEAADQLTERYSRHALLRGFGEQGQTSLNNARILVIGAGGLGSPALLYLAAAGVGTLAIIDPDTVDLSNLQRQVVHATASVGMSKVDSAAATLRALNPNVAVVTYNEALTSENALDLLSQYDVVVDGADSFAARYLTSDAATITGIPHVWGSVHEYSGQVSVFDAAGPSYRDLFPIAPPPEFAPTCSEAGVLGALCGVIGATMAMEAIKLVTSVGQTLSGRLAIYDAETARWRELAIPVDDAREQVTALGDYQDVCAVIPSRILTIEENALRARLGSSAVVLDVRTPQEFAAGHIPGTVNVPLDSFAAQLGEHATPTDQLVLVCQRGQRSRAAGEIAVDAGFTHVESFAGGLDAWSGVTIQTHMETTA
ncbi:molybdopterin-synthase adenylyltransferase MoeB [Curtobacterium sp. 8I-2]|uniref:molybdopterin-synthase adenylyltransferase MoeB n=1 Tax=Curtobacterium sp. 8I-2 TaxID=2653136 RepID=UPI0012F3820F|nr:molybdopterin-synthase adenylyltransferase MoeB [Curtobacterium sp. 8I-2]VXB37424.1 Sulfur carrier protein CysO adenylyltransferase / Sulfur carrier protein CysO sulfurtransferase [Curtobacterium sp. 8I-2]